MSNTNSTKFQGINGTIEFWRRGNDLVWIGLATRAEIDRMVFESGIPNKSSDPAARATRYSMFGNATTIKGQV